MKKIIHTIVIFMILVGSLMIGWLLPIATAAPNAALTVDTLTDELDGSCADDCSLRDAIALASAGDTILFSVSGTIDVSGLGQLVIDKDLTINGEDKITLSGNNSTRVLYIAAGDIVLSQISVKNGYVDEFSLNPAGAGLSIDNLSSIVQITGSTFFSNATTSGGAIYNKGYLSIDDSTIQDNQAFRTGGGIFSAGQITLTQSILSSNQSSRIGDGGGGLYSSGRTMIRGTTIVSNTSGDFGGGLRLSGSVFIYDSQILNNTAGRGGGGIYTYDFWGNSLIEDTTISYNEADDEGGGILNSGWMTITGTTISYNTATATAEYGGGGIKNSKQVFMSHSTVSNNTSTGWAGGIFNASYNSVMYIVNSTISQNRGLYRGAGILNYGKLSILNGTIAENLVTSDISGEMGAGIAAAGTTTLTNTIVANNTLTGTNAMNDISAYTNPFFPFGGSTLGTDHFVSGGTNLIGVTSEVITAFNTLSDLTGVIDPKLGGLADNSGSTHTHALLEGSPAIDAGSNGVCPSTDQRRVSRPVDGDLDETVVCDIGAYEVSFNTKTYIYLPLVITP